MNKKMCLVSLHHKTKKIPSQGLNSRPNLDELMKVHMYSTLWKTMTVCVIIDHVYCKGFFKKGYSPSLPVRPTGIPLDTLKHIGNVFSTAPGGDFKIHGGK